MNDNTVWGIFWLGAAAVLVSIVIAVTYGVTNSTNKRFDGPTQRVVVVCPTGVECRLEAQ